MQLQKLQKVDSTNHFLSNLISEQGVSAENIIIWAEEQTAGRGQQGNSWHSQTGKNLTFSFFLVPEFLEAVQQFYLSKIVALAVCDLLGKITSHVKIKWPNDIYVKDKKIGGILIENTLKGNNLWYSIIGIGLNINQQTFPDDLPNPVSLWQVTKQEYNREELLRQYFVLFQKWYKKLVQNEKELINTAYIQQLYGYQQKRHFRRGGTILKGIITGVSESGHLLVKSENKNHRFNFKEVELINYIID